MTRPRRAAPRPASDWGRRAVGSQPRVPVLPSLPGRVAALCVALVLAFAATDTPAFADTPPRVTVRPGETLSEIALRYYGDSAEAARIAKVNKLLNPDLLLAGSDLILPPAPTPTAGTPAGSSAGAARRVTVAPGDTLSGIALRMYGSTDQTEALVAANGLASADLIRVGQELILPATLAAAAAPASAPAAGGGGGTVAGRRVCIDPGHGGADPGAIYQFDNGRILRESDVALDISLALAGRLRARGADVTLTRQTDLTLDLADRAYRCNVNSAQIAISVHLNGVSNAAVNGALTLHGKPADRSLAEVMAGVLQSGLFGGSRSDATAFGARHFDARVLIYTTMPAVLVEPSFITNPIEARALQSPASDPTSRRAQIARELERGLLAYLR